MSEAPLPELVASEPLLSSGYLRVVRDTVRFVNGHEAQRTVVEHPGAVALIVLGASIGLFFEAGVSFTGLLTAALRRRVRIRRADRRKRRRIRGDCGHARRNPPLADQGRLVRVDRARRCRAGA